MLNLYENNIKHVFPEFFLLTTILLLILYASFFSVSNKYRYPLVNVSLSSILVFILCITWILLFSQRSLSRVIFNGAFICDVLSQNSKLLLVGLSIICIVISFSYLIDFKINVFDYYILFLLSIFGSLLICSSYDLISLYLALELQSLCLYVLATFDRNSIYSTEAGLKYFILGAFSSGVLLFGISILYLMTGSTNFEDLHLLFSLKYTSFWSLQIGLLLVSCAFLFKIAGAPFHIWVADVYEGSPLMSTLFFAVVPKLGIFVLFLRFFFFCFGVQFFYCQYILLLSALLSILVGSFLALKQQKIKRLLAYSSVSHIGYVILAFGSGSLEGFHAAFFYLVVYSLTSLGIWAVILCFKSRFVRSKTLTLLEFSVLNKTNMPLGFCTAFFIFSLAGVPPLIGFFSKFYVFFVALNLSFYLFSALIIVINVVSTFYYLRLVKTVFFESIESHLEIKSLSKEISLVLSSCWFFLMFFFFNPNLLWLFTEEAVLSVIV